MSTHNHAAIATGAAANASTVNTPLGTIDAAIGNLATLTTTAKTSAVAALNEVDANADAANAAIGTLASLTTTTKTSVVAAINEVDALIGAAASASGSIGTSIDTDGTLKAGAVTAGKIAVGGISNSNQLAANTVGATAIASGVVANSHLATDVKVGSLASLQTKTKTSVQAAINDVFNSERAGELFSCTTATWTPATKIFQVSGIYIIHGTSAFKYLTIAGTVDMDFSSVAAPQFLLKDRLSASF